MNKTKIEWVANPDGSPGYTWNPVTGCLHGCEFCYAKRINRRFGDGNFIPTFHRERLDEPLTVKKPSRIFVGSMADLFGDWDWAVGSWEFSTSEVMTDIFEIINQCSQHTFMFLTKNPRGMQGFDFPDNCWCGTSVENQENADARIPELLKVNCRTLFVSYEPALGAVEFKNGSKNRWSVPTQTNKEGIGIEWTDPGESYIPFHWLIIGAQTGPGAVKPNPDWIDSAIKQFRAVDVPVFVKDNVGWPEQIREWPEGVKI